MIDWEQYDREEKEREEYRRGFNAFNYTGEPCVHCGRNRVMNCINGKKVCEKCGWDNIANCYTDFLSL